MDRRDFNRFKGFSRRALLLGGVKVGLASALLARLYYLQVLESDRYSMLSDDNRISVRMLPPLRGRLLDRYGEEIANNRRNFRVLIVPEQTESLRGTLNRLAQLIPLDDVQRARVLREAERRRKFVPIAVAENLSWEDFSRVNLYSPDLPGVQLDVGETRAYPAGATFSHIVGHVGAVSEQDLKQSTDPLLELPGFRIGKSGLEKVYDEQLRGTAGGSQVEVNAYGRVIRELTRHDGQPGADLVLTIDADLQRFATDRLADQSAAAVIMDVTNGDIIAMVSNPGFDPNLFNVGISSADWRALNQHKLKPLVNKVLQGQYPPGSTFKMIVALAALESGIVLPAHSVFCPGHMELGDAKFHCWKKGGHGTVGFVQGIGQSCDVFFYDVARRIGPERIAEMAKRLGVGVATGIDMPSEAGGLAPTRDWKFARFGQRWAEGESLVVGIGQGYVLATPLQLAVMTARIASGRAVTPRVVRRADEREPVAAKPLGLNPAHLNIIYAGMNAVSNVPGNTAYAARIKTPGRELAGKTGSAQVKRISKAERESGVIKQELRPWEDRDHALFVAYAPVGNPRYAVSVVVEHGMSGARTAAPIARDILEETQKRDPASRPMFRGRFPQDMSRRDG
jgi:penicillin-binding protein 2